jgi:hypothetical protein
MSEQIRYPSAEANRVVLYRHAAAFCDDCGKWVQQPGKGEILGSRIGPHLRGKAIYLRNVIGISYRKVPQAIQEMFGIAFTPAALIGFETMLADLAEPVVDDIAQKLASSEGPVHADETYWTTDGARSYFWVHGDEKYIYSWTTRAFHRQTTWRSEPSDRWWYCGRSPSGIAAPRVRSGWRRL